jgi:predicted HTH domain antitoxin
MSRLSIDLPSHISSDEARLLLSIKLYEAERISLDAAATLAGYSTSAYAELLAKEGLSVTDVSSESPDRETNEDSEQKPLQGTVKRYDRPTDPVAENDWNSLR